MGHVTSPGPTTASSALHIPMGATIRRQSTNSLHGFIPPPLEMVPPEPLADPDAPVTIRLVYEMELCFPVFDSNREQPVRWEQPTSTSPSLAASMAGSAAQMQQSQLLSQSTVSLPPAALLKSEWQHKIDVLLYPPIVTLAAAVGDSAANASPAASAPVYTEGEGETSFWGGLALRLTAVLPSLHGGSAAITFVNDCDPGDAIVLRTAPGQPLAFTTSTSSGGTFIHYGGEVVAELVSRGPLVMVHTALGLDGTPAGVQPAIKQPRRKVGVERSVVFRLSRACTAEAVLALFGAMRYVNLSKNPVESTRRMHIGVSFPNGLQSFVQTEFIVVGVDDPTVIDFGVSVVPFRLPPTLPAQFDDFLPAQPFYFASLCSVFDVDTSMFEGGNLKVTITNPRRSDTLAFEPLAGGELELTEAADDDQLVRVPTTTPGSMVTVPPRSVTFRHTEIATLTEDADRVSLLFTFTKATIEGVEAIFKALTFSTAVPKQGVAMDMGNRLVVFNLVCGNAEPVHTSCTISIGQPLVSMPIAQAYWTYREKSDLQPIGQFTLAADDEGWDGGFITLDIVDGGEPDDILTLRELDGIRLLDDGSTPTSPRPSIPGPGSSGNLEATPSLRTIPRPASTRGVIQLKKSSATSPAESPADARLDVPPVIKASQEKPDKTSADLKALWRNRAAEKVRQLAQARQRTHDDLRLRVLEQIRSNRKSVITTRVEKIITLHDNKIGTLAMWPGGLSITLNRQKNVDPSRPRSSLCQLRRRDVNALLKNLCYKSVNDNPPDDAHKIVRLTINDGLPHATVAAVKITVEPIDDVTEMRRLNHEPRKFRAQSFEDTSGFTFYDDVTLHDPDTFAFNGAVLRIDMVGGGDPRFDQLGIITPSQQSLRGFQKDDLVVHHPNDTLTLGGRVIGTATVELPSAASASSVTIAFAPYPSTDAPPVPKTVEDLQGNPFAVSILDVERVLHSIIYTTQAATVKSGVRIYQAHLRVDQNDSRLKAWLDVHPPLLAMPEYGAELQFREGRPPVAVFGKATVTYDSKQIVKTGEVSVVISTNFQDGADKLDLVLGKTQLSVAKGGLWAGKDYIGAVIVTDRNIDLKFDWASKGTSKHIQAFIRSISFVNTSSDPTTEPRKIELVVAIDRDTAPSKLVSTIAVVAEDNPTEVHLPQNKVEVVRGGRPVRFCESAEVVDPDTTVFTAPSYVSVELKGGNIGTDTIWLDGLPLDAATVEADLDAVPLPALGGSRRLSTSTSPQSRSPGTQSPQSGSLNPTSAASLGDKDMRPPRCMARVERFDGKRVGLTLHIVHCTLDELASMIRRLTLQCDDSGRDRENKKGVALCVQSGTAPMFRTSVGVDVLPALIEIPFVISTQGITYLGSPMEPFGAATIAAVHCENGAVLTVAIRPRTDEHELLTTPYSLSLTNKVGMTLRDLNASAKATAGTSAKAHAAASGTTSTAAKIGDVTAALMLEGKRVGTVVSTARHRLVIKLPTASSASLAQKALRSISFACATDIIDDVVVEATLRDVARDNMDYTCAVTIAPPGLRRSASKRILQTNTEPNREKHHGHN
jgi:hypothetical protein